MDGPVSIGRAGSGPRPPRLLRTMIGEVLRRTRLAQGRTLADVARAARVSMPYLSEVERGRKEASSEVLAAICEALRIDLSDLLAQAWRDLAVVRDRRARALAGDGGPAGAARVIRLGSAGGPAAAPSRPGPADGRCLLAA